MLRIAPKGFDNCILNQINIPFTDVKSCTELKDKLKSEYNLENGILLYKYSNSLNCYFEEPYLVDSNRIILVDYVNKSLCVEINIEWFDRDSCIMMYVHDNLHKAVFSVGFMIPSKKYKFYLEDNLIEINKKFSELIDFDSLKSSYKIKAVLYE